MANNILYQKKVDKSLLTEGFTLADNSYLKFAFVNGQLIKKGEKINIDLEIDGAPYSAKVTHVNVNEIKYKDREHIFQIRYNANTAKQIRKQFPLSSKYILEKHASLKSKKSIKLPDNLEAYVNILSTIKNNTYKLECIEKTNDKLFIEENVEEFNSKSDLILDIDSDITFNTIKDIINHYFGKSINGYQQGTYKISDYVIAWFPKISNSNDIANDNLDASKCWTNYFSEDHEYLTEVNTKLQSDTYTKHLNMLRVLFYKDLDNKYKFGGIYKFSGNYDDTTKTIKRIYKRIDTSISIKDLNDNYFLNDIENEIKQITGITNINDTEKQALVKQRIGQSAFRDMLMEKYSCKCALCNISHPKLLRASHIKPWCDCNNDERLDHNNGLLLCALHDAAFDKHLISFEDDGTLKISNHLSENDQRLLKSNKKGKLNLSDKTKQYMKHHRNNFK